MAFTHRFSSGSLTVFLLLILPAVEGGRELPAGDSKTAASNTEFIRSSCGAARFPELCFSSLSSYASTIKSSPKLLASTALSISLDGAHAAWTAMRAMNPARMSRMEAVAMSDCVENVGDSIDELRKSIAEMAYLGRGRDIGFQINSIQTWVSAALTNDDTCMDNFGAKAMDGSLKTAVRGRVANLAHLTSNALYLINALASTLYSP